jgi:hypothetical protein
MRAKEIPELCWNRAGDHEVVDWHQLVHPGIEPIDSLLGLTGRTMSVSAGSEDPIGIGAVFTGAYDRSQRFGPALDDCSNYLFVIARHPLAKGVQIRLSVGKENITYGHW